VRGGETDVIECKLNYSVSGKIIKAIAGLANNKGGHILFGINDKELVVDGMSDDKFETLDPSILNSHLVSFLDPVPRVARVSHGIGGKRIGVLHVEKHEIAPVIVLKGMGNDLREGSVYFRYVGGRARSSRVNSGLLSNHVKLARLQNLAEG
jgi:predicted HTH transcriptional regulator